MKTLIKFLTAIFAVILIISIQSANAQYSITNSALNVGNPGGVRTSTDQTTTGETIINAYNNGSSTTNKWSAAQTIPFTFQFNGSAVTQYCVSKNGLLTFTTSVANTTVATVLNTNRLLPYAGLPNNTICYFWEDKPTSALSSNDDVYSGVAGTAPNRQLWIRHHSQRLGSMSFSYFAVVLEETTNKIYVVDMNYKSGNCTATIGTQINSTTAVQVTTGMASAAGSPNIIMGTGSYTAADNEYYIMTYSPPTPMTYTSSTTTQSNTGTVGQGFSNNEIIGVEVVMAGNINILNLTNLAFNTTGTTAPTTDISNAKVWYTGTGNTFDTTAQFGSVVAAPNGTFSITGSQALVDGTNHFWLSYDIPATATLNNFVDAQCTQVTMSGSVGAKIPTITNPSGNRTIKSLCQFTATLEDSFGDGWNGCKMTVKVNGTPVLTDITVASGYGPVVFPFYASTGDAITTSWTLGSYGSETSYTIKGPDGTVILQDGQGGTQPAATNGPVTGQCPYALDVTVIEIIPSVIYPGVENC